ncbi:MAG: protein kinase [Blastocatellia bacterium]
MLTNGTKLNHYKILAKLGAGGMGEVYRAEDSRLGREVAIKVLPESLAEDAESLNRFEREARALASLSHPNILTIYDVGVDQGIHFAVMELLKGTTLRDYIGKTGLPWKKLVEIAIAIASGLLVAHSKGIIHRDLKPENIFLTVDGGLKILDFGLARTEKSNSSPIDTPNILEELAKQPVIKHAQNSIATSIVTLHISESDLLTVETNKPLPSSSAWEVETAPGVILGTVPYMSPEQIRGDSIDTRSDIFSFGSICYEMLTGETPFYRDNQTKTMIAILKDNPPELTNLDSLIPRELKEIINCCLKKEREERFSSVSEIIKALKQLEDVEIKPKTIDSLVILPLINADADTKLDYLCDGITESIINIMSRLPKLRVIARTTAFRYKNKDIELETIAKELSVGAVLTGRVLQQDEYLTIQVELVDVSSNSQLWGEHYHRKNTDIFALQEEIAKQVSKKLKLKLSSKEKQGLKKRSTSNMQAYQLYLRGRFYWNKRTEEDFVKAIEYFEQAIELDPKYSLAYSGLADCYNMLYSYGVLTPKDATLKGRSAIIKALELDPTSAEAHTSFAYLLEQYDYDWAGAEAKLKTAIKYNPNYPVAHHWYAILLMSMGRTEESLKEINIAQKLDPLSLIINGGVSWMYYLARQYDKALEQCHLTLEMEPNFGRTYYFLGAVYEQQGRYDEAIKALQTGVELSKGSLLTLRDLAHTYAISGNTVEAEKILKHFNELSKKRYIAASYQAIIYVGLGKKNLALTWLEKAFQDRSYWVTLLNVDPRLDSLRNEPRFIKLLKQIGLK